VMDVGDLIFVLSIGGASAPQALRSTCWKISPVGSKQCAAKPSQITVSQGKLPDILPFLHAQHTTLQTPM
jgi:hypothetical protein